MCDYLSIGWGVAWVPRRLWVGFKRPRPLKVLIAQSSKGQTDKQLKRCVDIFMSRSFFYVSAEFNMVTR